MLVCQKRVLEDLCVLIPYFEIYISECMFVFMLDCQKNALGDLCVLTSYFEIDIFECVPMLEKDYQLDFQRALHQQK